MFRLLMNDFDDREGFRLGLGATCCYRLEFDGRQLDAMLCRFNSHGACAVRSLHRLFDFKANCFLAGMVSEPSRQLANVRPSLNPVASTPAPIGRDASTFPVSEFMTTSFGGFGSR